MQSPFLYTHEDNLVLEKVIHRIFSSAKTSLKKVETWTSVGGIEEDREW
jgi:hypothetical protein